MRTRHAARILLFDPQNHLLLFRFAYETGALTGTVYWGVPGGGVEAGETPAEAAVRELFEETGLRVASVGPEMAESPYPFRLSTGEEVTARDHYFILRLDKRPSLSRDGLTPEETVNLVERRWWSADELRATRENIIPSDLVEVLRRAGAERRH